MVSEWGHSHSSWSRFSNSAKTPPIRKIQRRDHLDFKRWSRSFHFCCWILHTEARVNILFFHPSNSKTSDKRSYSSCYVTVLLALRRPLLFLESSQPHGRSGTTTQDTGCTGQTVRLAWFKQTIMAAARQVGQWCSNWNKDAYPKSWNLNDEQSGDFVKMIQRKNHEKSRRHWIPTNSSREEQKIVDASFQLRSRRRNDG